MVQFGAETTVICEFQETSDNQNEKRKGSRHVGKFEETVMTILGGLLNMNMRKGKDYKPDEDKELPLYARYFY